MKLKPYPEYKDTSLEWLGGVPAHWEVRPLKRWVSTRITDGPHETPTVLGARGIASASGERASPLHVSAGSIVDGVLLDIDVTRDDSAVEANLRVIVQIDVSAEVRIEKLVVAGLRSLLEREIATHHESPVQTVVPRIVG